MNSEDTYLGDGVYAKDDRHISGQVVLYTFYKKNIIYFEPETVETLVKWLQTRGLTNG